MKVDSELLKEVGNTVEIWTKKVNNWTPQELALVAICRFLELQIELRKEKNEKISPKT